MIIGIIFLIICGYIFFILWYLGNIHYIHLKSTKKFVPRMLYFCFTIAVHLAHKIIKCKYLFFFKIKR